MSHAKGRAETLGPEELFGNTSTRGGKNHRRGPHSVVFPIVTTGDFPLMGFQTTLPYRKEAGVEDSLFADIIRTSTRKPFNLQKLQAAGGWKIQSGPGYDRIRTHSAEGRPGAGM